MIFFVPSQAVCSIFFNLEKKNPHLFIRTSCGKIVSCPGESNAGRWTLECREEEDSWKMEAMIESNYAAFSFSQTEATWCSSLHSLLKLKRQEISDHGNVLSQILTHKKHKSCQF